MFKEDSDFYEDLDWRASKAGLYIDKFSSSKIEFKSEKDGKVGKVWPTVSVKLEHDDKDNVIYFEPTITFPKIEYDNIEYDDSVEYFVKEWMDVAKFCTYLMKNPYDPDKWEEEEEE